MSDQHDQDPRDHQPAWDAYRPGTPAPEPAPGPGPAPAGPYPYVLPAAYTGRPHPGANTALGLGIASLVCAVLTFVCCLTLPGVLCGPVAIVLALKAQREMAAQPGVYQNGGAATAGLVTGIVGTVLGLLVVVLVAVFLGFAFSL